MICSTRPLSLLVNHLIPDLLGSSIPVKQRSALGGNRLYLWVEILLLEESVELVAIKARATGAYHIFAPVKNSKSILSKIHMVMHQSRGVGYLQSSSSNSISATITKVTGSSSNSLGPDRFHLAVLLLPWELFDLNLQWHNSFPYIHLPVWLDI
ncbi:hypothetical protein Tco_0582780 [Tanacetum coccineum]